MPHNPKLARSILVIFLSLVAGVTAALWTYDLIQDRQYKVVIEGPVELYRDPDSAAYPQRGSKALLKLKPGEPVQVKRVNYTKDFMVIKVETSQGVTGWITNDQNVRLIRPEN